MGWASWEVRAGRGCGPRLGFLAESCVQRVGGRVEVGDDASFYLSAAWKSDLGTRQDWVPRQAAPCSVHCHCVDLGQF